VLAALIIHAVSHLWKLKAFRRYLTEAPAEFLLGLATLIGVITLDVLPGLLIGVVSMLLLVIEQASRPYLGVLGRVPGVPGAYGDVERHPDYEQIPELLVLRLEAPLFYANATPVRDQVKTLVGASHPVPHAVVLEGGAIHRLDITSAEMLSQLTSDLHGAGVDFALADVRLPVIEMARRSGLLDLLGHERVFVTIDEAVQTLGARTRP
jgi:sulfate permease, SulP family